MAIIRGQSVSETTSHEVQQVMNKKKVKQKKSEQQPTLPTYLPTLPTRAVLEAADVNDLLHGFSSH